jgi:hypothetical protein
MFQLGIYMSYRQNDSVVRSQAAEEAASVHGILLCQESGAADKHQVLCEDW